MVNACPAADPVFRINQGGYAAGLPVHIAVLKKGPVSLLDTAGRLSGIFDAVPVPDEASGDSVALINLGTLPEGNWLLRSGQAERAFTVSPHPWQKTCGALVKGLYYQRCGCALLPEHAGLYTHATCHTAPAIDWEDRSVRRAVTGGWHDAGDYGKYTGPGAVTAAHLLYAWKLFPDGCPDRLDLPETGNGLPDILNEARYELDWLLKMQRDDGAFHHKLAKAAFAPFIMPEDDKGQEYLMPVSSCATGAACACLALASRVYRPFLPSFANRLLLAALRAWAWLAAHPDFLPFRNPEGVRTGQYSDRSDRDERFWAACELFASTNEDRFRQAAETLYMEGHDLTQFGWASVAGFGAICCLFDMKEKAGETLCSALKQDFLAQSGQALAAARRSGYGTALSPDRYIWGSILPIMSGAMAMILNALITGRQDMRDAALDQWHYALGMNALDTCFITGIGEKPILHPHHRPSGADGIDAPVPGLISGGPNKAFPYPATREMLGDAVPPAKYFRDETPSADTNEIAIYWNSPAVFVSAYFNTF